MSTSVKFEVPRAVEIVESASAIAQAVAGISRYVDARIAQAADTLDRTNIAQANVNVAMTAILATLPLLYRSDASGKHCNVDEATRRILFPLPWCGGGWKRWGLRQQSQSRVLNRILRNRPQSGPQRCMFLYHRQRWYVASWCHSIEMANEYWRKWPVTAKEWANVD